MAFSLKLAQPMNVFHFNLFDFSFGVRWESSNPVHGRSRNPYDANRIVGGSSGGEGCLLVSIYA